MNSVVAEAVFAGNTQPCAKCGKSFAWTVDFQAEQSGMFGPFHVEMCPKCWYGSESGSAGRRQHLVEKRLNAWMTEAEIRDKTP